jgi:hypothetical protein
MQLGQCELCNVLVADTAHFLKSFSNGVISGFRRDVEQIRTFLRRHAVRIDVYETEFGGNPLVPRSVDYIKIGPIRCPEMSVRN